MKERKRSKKANNLPYMILFSLIVCICAITIILFVQKEKSKQLPKSSVVSTLSKEPKIYEQEKEQSKPEIKRDATVNFIGVGDDLIHEAIYRQANQRAGGNGYDFEFAYENVADTINKADIASINQETVMADIYELSAYPRFNSPVELGMHLQKIGFDVFNQANNHVLDMGEKGLLSTLDFWSEQNVKLTGVYKNEEDFEKIRIIKSNDIVFSFIGMTELTNGLNLPEDSNIVLLRLNEEEKIKHRIMKARQISDVVIINTHWGIEYTHKPNERQKEMARKMIDWGADIILGHHPHVIQPVEYIQREDGTKGIVAYSLGNFISAQDKPARMIGGMLDVSVTKSYQENKVYISSAKFVPIVNHYDRGYRNLRNYLLDDYTQELALSHGVRTKHPDFSLDYINNTVKSVIDEEFLN